MQADYDKALEVFERLSEDKKAPSLHPYYIITDAKRDPESIPVFFIYEDCKDAYYHGFLLSPVPGTVFYDIQSPYGYGGPVASSDDSSFIEKAWSAYLSWCRDRDVLAEFIRFHPLLKNWRCYGSKVIDDRQTVWIDLRQEYLLMSYNIRARTAIRKAKKNGLCFEWDVDGRHRKDFSDLYETSMKELNADSFYCFNEEYIEGILNWDKSRLGVCKLDGVVIAAAIFLMDNLKMEYHLSASNSMGKKFSATNLLLHEAALYGQQVGCRIFHLGGGTDSRPDNALLFFKSGFSSARAFFKIGRHIHKADEYNALKSKWEQKYSKEAGRVLFYRS